jgi:hypothetical protein
MPLARLSTVDALAIVGAGDPAAAQIVPTIRPFGDHRIDRRTGGLVGIRLRLA